MIIDEGHFIKRETINTLLGFIPESCRYLIVSTPPVKESNIMDIIHGKDPATGQAMSKYVYLNYNCPACTKIQEKHPGHRCMENEQLRPRFLDARAIVKGRGAYGTSTDAANRELYGSALTVRHVFINPKHIERLRKAERRPFSSFVTSPDYLYISIDPSGSVRKRHVTDSHKRNSDYAIVTVFMAQGVYYVIFFSFFLSKLLQQQLLFCIFFSF